MTTLKEIKNNRYIDNEEKLLELLVEVTKRYNKAVEQEKFWAYFL